MPLRLPSGYGLVDLEAFDNPEDGAAVEEAKLSVFLMIMLHLCVCLKFKSVTVASAQSIDSFDVSFAHVSDVSVLAQPVQGLLLERASAAFACCRTRQIKVIISVKYVTTANPVVGCVRHEQASGIDRFGFSNNCF